MAAASPDICRERHQLFSSRPPVLALRRLKIVKIANGTLSMRRGLEDGSLVARKNGEPGLKVRRMIRPRLELRRNAEIGAEEAAAKLGDEFLAGALASISRIPGKIPADAAGWRRPMRFMPISA